MASYFHKPTFIFFFKIMEIRQYLDNGKRREGHETALMQGKGRRKGK
jgi:hypothetical protein